MAELFELTLSPLGTDVVLLAFRGSDAISKPYRYRVLVSLPTAAVPTAADVVGVKATLRIQPDPDVEAEQVHGVATDLQVLDPTGERSLVLVTLRPRLWQLSLTRHNRVFTETSIPEVITKVLEANGWADGTDFELKLDHSYADEAHICQYKESDLAFIARWLEHEGMVYFFDQAGDVDKLIISDHKSFHEAGPAKAIRYYPLMSRSAAPVRGAFERFVPRKQLVPKAVRTVDYDYAHPTLELSAEEDVAAGTEAIAVDHGARFWEPGEGKRLAKIRKEEQVAGAQSFEGEGHVPRVRPGYRFELCQHPRDCFNKAFLCTSSERHGNLRGRSAAVRNALGIEDDEVYRVRCKAILASVQYRHPRSTPRPRIHGFERATIDGPADSDYAQLDDDGRYQVRFGFDEEDNADGSASTAVRMMQPHGGNPEGWHLPLRKGTEVLVAFVGGDPDRPVIAGAVPNAETPSPVTADNHTRNVFISGGENWLEIGRASCRERV